MPAGRPVEYTDELKAEIIAHVLVQVACGRPVSRTLREDEVVPGTTISIPSHDTFWRWVFADDTGELADKLARAREYGIEALIDEALEVAATPEMGETHTIERIKPSDMDVNDLIDDGPQDLVKTTRADMLGHRKLYIETIFKAAQMLKPKKYGAKLDLTSGGEKIGTVEALEQARERARRMLDEDKQKETDQ